MPYTQCDACNIGYDEGGVTLTLQTPESTIHSSITRHICDQCATKIFADILSCPTCDIFLQQQVADMVMELKEANNG